MNTITITYVFINSGVQTFREPFAALSRSFATAAKTHIHMCKCHSDTKSLAWVLERLPYASIRAHLGIAPSQSNNVPQKRIPFWTFHWENPLHGGWCRWPGNGFPSPFEMDVCSWEHLWGFLVAMFDDRRVFDVTWCSLQQEIGILSHCRISSQAHEEIRKVAWCCVQGAGGVLHFYFSNSACRGKNCWR